MTKYIFFSGKGDVGKTTMASATAIHYGNEIMHNPVIMIGLAILTVISVM